MLRRTGIIGTLSGLLALLLWAPTAVAAPAASAASGCGVLAPGGSAAAERAIAAACAQVDAGT
ncbi:hypothetical protein AB0I69_13315 [Streptomyces sp. NPDC050508]|uniref:hypothetical protein n=1 Tax=Streptomyces sp. NPDC050508 TaxID=3155405 RepID=UPI0034165337